MTDKGEITTSPTLSRLTEDGLAIQRLLLDSDLPDDDRETLAQALDSIDCQWIVKVNNIANLVLEFEYRIDSFKQEIARLTAIRRTLKNRLEWLKSYTVENMVAKGEEKGYWFSDIGQVSVHKNPPSVKVTNLIEVPEGWIRPHVVTEDDVDKRGILEGWKENSTVPSGCEIITDKKSLHIRRVKDEE